MKKLFVSLLAIAMILAMSACSLIPGVTPTEPETYTVTFYNGTEVYTTVEVAPGAALELPKAPKGEKGKGLVGWSTIDGDVEEVIDPATLVVEGDLSLYALWADVYTVVINADNGTTFTVMEVFAGTVLEQPADPVKEGFKFVEWRDALAETTYDWTQPVYADITIKAMYGDGSANRVSDTKWDFSTGIHGSWFGGQSAWQKVEDNGIAAADMVYETTEDGYAAWGFTLTDSLENIPVINGENGKGYGMKFLYNEGISVEASKAKVVVVYVKSKYYPIDLDAGTNDQFRISILTGNGGKIYGYGTGCQDWAIHSAGVNKELLQVDEMEDGWIRVQFKIHELAVWSEDTVIKGMSIAFVQRPSTPVMDILSLKSIELLDQEEFVDPHVIDYVEKTEWDMSNAEDSANWFGSINKGSNTTSVKTTLTENGTSYFYDYANAWRGLTLDQAKIDISKCSGLFSATIDISEMSPTNYRLYIKTDAGGNLYDNSLEDKACYYVATSPTDLAEGWTIIENADGTITIYYDLTMLEHWKNGTVLEGLTFVTVDSSTTGTVVYHSISLVSEIQNTHNCETDGHIWANATCVLPKTCTICGATEGEAGGGHTWVDATCTTPKTCSVCGTTEGEANGHAWVDATCVSPVTCSTCGATKGARLDHTYVEGVCSGCGLELVTEFTQISWDMANAEASGQWYSAQNKTVVKPEVTYITVTENGSVVTYAHTNAWKGIRLENAAIDMSKLTGKLSFTYSTNMNITTYRAYILTDRGGHLAENTEAKTGHDPVDFYSQIAVTDIADSSVWTSTENADGTITVTCDLTGMGYWDESTILKGLCITTVSGDTGEVVYKSIELEEKNPKTWDMTNADVAAQWYSAQNYTSTSASVTTMEQTDAGLKVSYLHKNGWKGIILKDVEVDITKVDGLLSFTYIEEMDITAYRIHVLTDKGGDLTSKDKVTPNSDYYVSISLGDIAASESWTRTENADGTVTVTFDLNTLPFFAEGTVLMGMDIVTVTATGTTGTVTYTNIGIN